MKKLRTVIVGLGGMGMGQLQILTKELPDRFEVVAGVDPRQEARQQAMKDHGVPQTFPDAAEMIKACDFDLAAITAPEFQHWPVMREVGKKARIILCEKPLAHSLADCRAMRKFAATFKGRIYFDLELRFDPAMRALKRTIAEGRLGEPRVAWAKEFRCPFLCKPTRWIQQQEFSGGVLPEKNVHHFDAFSHLFGAKPLAVSAFGGRDVVKRLYDAPYTVMDNAVVNVEYEGSRRAALTLCMFMDKPLGGHEIGVIGDKGMALWADGKLRLSDRHGREVSTMEFHDDEASWSSHGGLVYQTYKNLLADLEKRPTPIARIDDIYWATLTGLAGEISAAEGRIVKLSELHRGA